MQPAALCGWFSAQLASWRCLEAPPECRGRRRARLHCRKRAALCRNGALSPAPPVSTLRRLPLRSQVKLIDFGAACDLCTGINFNPEFGMLDPRYAGEAGPGSAPPSPTPKHTHRHARQTACRLPRKTHSSPALATSRNSGVKIQASRCSLELLSPARGG